MVKNVVQSYTGYIQVQDKKYWDEKIIDNSLAYSEETINKISSVKNVSLVSPRLESFALVSHGNNTKGAIVLGIDPEAENKLTKLSSKIISGNMLSEDSRGVLVSERLAKYLKVELNDTLVLIGQGYHGVSAADKFPVEGIIKIPQPDLDNKLIK